MAWDDDRQAVVAARLADRARVGAKLARKLAVGTCLAARDRAHRIPHATLQRRTLDHHGQIELRVRICAIALKLTCRPLGTRIGAVQGAPFRSEEHTSELQSLRQLVCRHLLEKTN